MLVKDGSSSQGESDRQCIGDQIDVANDLCAGELRKCAAFSYSRRRVKRGDDGRTSLVCPEILESKRL